MLNKIIELSVRNKLLVLVATFFVVCVGAYCLRNTPIDAIPDLSDVQVVVFTEFAGQAPQVVEDQVTYPLTTQMLSVPSAKTVRGYSFFGMSFVYIIFEDGTDIYWARSRVLEYLNYASGKLPVGVKPSLGPDATGVGWVYEYALESDRHDLQELRSIQDWYLRYELTALRGVSEVASVGGFVKQYQVAIDPNRLVSYGIPLSAVKKAISDSNTDVGGRLIESAETEYMIRGLGYFEGKTDIESVIVKVSDGGVPVLLSDIATISIGPELRRGVAELDGRGEVVGGVVVMRYGENALATIDRVKTKLKELQVGLPEGVKIIPVYDRSGLIERAVDTLNHKLLEESVVVALVTALFLFHLPSALVAIITLPVAILMAFIVMSMMGVNANIMSLGGIAIAIGAMIDGAIIFIENAHKHLERSSGERPRSEIILESAKEVGPTIFYSLLVITVSFLPVFVLDGQSGRLFKPLAYTKTFSMAAAALLSITLVPVLMGWFIRGRIRTEEENPVSRFLIHIYGPIVDFVLKNRVFVIVAAVAMIASLAVPIKNIGSEFMPPLYEGDLLYMPTTLPGLSIAKAKEVLQQTDKIIASFPEVERVFGKVGRADTATDPAPLSMLETTIMLKPESEWRQVDVERFYSSWPSWLKAPFAGLFPEKRTITVDGLISELNNSIQFPGLTNAWTMPIRTRIDMLSTGIKTPVGIKVMGDNLETLGEIGEQIEAVVRDVPGTLSAFSERVVGGNYLDVKVDRLKAARYGLKVKDVQDIIQSAIGGMNVTTTVEGLERYPVNVRYNRDYRDSVEDLERVYVTTPTGVSIPLGAVANISFQKGPPVIKSENARQTAWVFVDLRGVDVGTYVNNAKKAIEEKVEIPEGYSIVWSGQYEYMQKAKERLIIVVPLTLLIVSVIIFLNTRSVVKTAIVMLAVPFSLVGAFWLVYLMGYNMSISVWVGLIALAGLDAETGVVMLLYLDLAYDKWHRAGKLNSLSDLKDAVHYGAVKRVRPKVMTIAVIIAGLLPIMWSHGAGADVMQRIAAPMVGGILTSGFMELLVFPVIYFSWKAMRINQTTK